MKILSVHSSVPQDVAEWWRISNIAKIQEDNGHEVKFVHYCRKSAYDELENKERYSNHKFVITSPLGVQAKHLKVLREDKYDLVYANNYYAGFIALIGKLLSTPLLLDLHGDPVEELLLERESNRNIFFLLRYVQFQLMFASDLQFSDHVLCVSQRMIEHLHHHRHVPLDKMSYVTNGVDLEFFHPKNNQEVQELREKLELTGKLIFGYIGGVTELQGINNLLTAAGDIDNSEVEFLIVGGESRKKSKNITFIPKIPRSEVPLYYSLCDVLVLPRPIHPATNVAAPTKFVEYSAMAKPVLTTDVGDAADLVRKYKSGVVVRDNNPHNLVKGLQEIINLSPQELRKLGDNSRKMSEDQFDWKQVSQNLLKAMEKFH